MAHGIVGQRFFPATLTTDDPFVADEMSLPTFTHQKTSDDPSVKETDVNSDFAKTITPDFGFVMGYGWTHLDQLGPPHNPSGFSTFHITPQYQFLRDGPHEAVAMVGLIAEIGGTGAQRIGADTFTTLTPTLYLGKGAGDLPETMNFLRPFAVTGTFGYSIPMRNKTSTEIIDPDSGDVSLAVEHHSNALQYGLAIEYSLPYLTGNIRDLGLAAWMNRLTPLVEFSFTQPVDNRFGQQTTGTINPGIIWSGQSMQLSETQRWDVLAFLRAQADAERANVMAADVEPWGPVVAPDFAFQIGHSPQETLKEQRNRFIVLLVLFSDASSADRLRELDAATAQLERAGVRVVALPMVKDAEAPDKLPALAHLSIAETDPETIAAYSLFRRTPSVEGVPPMPAHMEFLIDRQGYLRNRWSPEYGTGWSRIAELVKRIDVLNREPPRPPAPEGHVH